MGLQDVPKLLIFGTVGVNMLPQPARDAMLDRVREIVGSAEVTAYERLALYEDRERIEDQRCYTEALYYGESGYFLAVEKNLFALSQQAAFSWLGRRGFYEVVLAIYSEIEGAEIELPEGDYFHELVQSEKDGKL